VRTRVIHPVPSCATPRASGQPSNPRTDKKLANVRQEAPVFLGITRDGLGKRLCRSWRITPSVEKSNTPTIRRLIPSCSHQLSPIAQPGAQTSSFPENFSPPTKFNILMLHGGVCLCFKPHHTTPCMRDSVPTNRSNLNLGGDHGLTHYKNVGSPLESPRHVFRVESHSVRPVFSAASIAERSSCSSAICSDNSLSPRPILSHFSRKTSV
jgi:hypothetical protein